MVPQHSSHTLTPSCMMLRRSHPRFVRIAVCMRGRTDRILQIGHLVEQCPIVQQCLLRALPHIAAGNDHDIIGRLGLLDASNEHAQTEQVFIVFRRAFVVHQHPCETGGSVGETGFTAQGTGTIAACGGHDG